ncbi:hypothetical protein FB567DRAFT_525089 [Paraphoma chrysanthemicola]|uniref:Uncharacterized protein n=1 Tax=Paraphoma chrysanthemicola TaxID=798071 RepID=A0A8K0R8J9_9PLEO|nr:hypothetical protein FB567DRAFT_525089 [Paraphoma chrysanthemicola]
MPSAAVTATDISPGSPPTAMQSTNPQSKHLNDATLLQIKFRMGSDAALLNYLPLEKVRLERFDDAKSERSTALPTKLHYGQIPNGRRSPKNVAILLCVSSKEDKPPEQQYNVFTRAGKLENRISISEAIRTANYGSSFTCIKSIKGMEPDYLRSVVKYYFIALRVDIPTIWTVDATFIKHLTAACRLARANLSRDRGITSSQMGDTIMEDHAAARVLMPRRDGDEGSASTENGGEQGRHIVTNPAKYTDPRNTSINGGGNSRATESESPVGGWRADFLGRLYGSPLNPSKASDQTAHACLSPGETGPKSPTRAGSTSSSTDLSRPADNVPIFSTVGTQLLPCFILQHANIS